MIIERPLNTIIEDNARKNAILPPVPNSDRCTHTHLLSESRQLVAHSVGHFGRLSIG